MVVETTVGSGSVGSVGTLRGSPVFEELKDFERFMTQPGASAQELPIRHSTAQVYMRHADLFLGWFAALATAPAPPAPAPAPALTPAPASALAPAPRQMHRERASAAAVYEYVQWLRGVRKISTSYEANVLRGLTKLAKFRFSQESLTDPSYGQKSFEDIPLVRELRKLHSDANRRQLNSPRVSNEQLKWMTWTDYLQVVGALRDDLQAELRGAQEAQGAKAGAGAKKTKVRLRVARAYQRYLLLAFFSCVPDRQRTFRELEIGRTFLQVEGQYLIQHGPEDYKTGNVYGERPPLMISKELTAAVDDFILNWREALAPTGPHLFVQARTGRALTADSVYALVSRACYEFAGKRTNPHLLRDIVVTHVRSTQASERELEALALYMGHSIGMQRSSYDRRTLPQKVAPAVLLLDSISRAPYNAQSLDISL
ncbi:hypothetical protein B484DRAFT_327140 [Ochromonadaceae sp. CCMP2298]|nr:hypothetical protein B484DRAFT_327140 [Ochromonadaceae sp. CCMP2298]